jgi:PAS domain-containing protein
MGGMHARLNALLEGLETNERQRALDCPRLLAAADALIAKMDAACAEADALRSATLFALTDLYFRQDHENRIIDYRAGYESDLALPPELFLGKRVTELPLGEGPIAVMVAAAEKARHEKCVATCEYELEMAGERRLFEARYAPLPEDHLVVLIRNTTEPKRLEEALRLTQFALDRLSDSAFWLTPDGRFYYSNEAAFRSLG